MATIRDVAKIADVSIATVSNYINGAKPVSKELAERIKQAIEQSQYAPNSSAKSLRSRDCHEIGVILPNFDDSYYVHIFQGIASAFENSKYFVNLTFSDDVPEIEQKNVKALLSKQICGLILVSCQPDHWKYYYDNFTAKGKPLVMIDRLIKALDANFVTMDNYSVIRQITDTLLGAGRKNLVLFSGSETFSCENDCIHAFCDAFSHAGLAPQKGHVIQTALSKEDAFVKAIHLLKSELPDVFLATSNQTAIGIIEALRLLGYSSKDVPVIALGEEHWNKYTQSFATFSTARPAIKIGSTAAALLLGQLATPMRDTEQVILTDSAVGNTNPFAEDPLKSAAASPRLPHASLKILMLDNPVAHTFQGLVKNFERASGVTTEIHTLPHRSILPEIQNCPEKYDIIMFDIPWIPALAASGILMDISDCLEQVDTSLFFDGCQQYFCDFHGKKFGVPFMYAPQMLYYRKDLFEDTALQASFTQTYGTKLRPPLTLKEYTAIAEFFTTQTDVIDYGVSVSAAYNECFAPEINFRLRTFGSHIYDQQGNVTFDNPQTLKAYINLKRTVRFAKPDYLKATDLSIVQDFLQGDTAMLITYPVFLSGVADLRKCSTSIGYSLVPSRTPLLGGWSFGISAKTQKKDEAVAFLKWTCNDRISNYFTIMGGQTTITSTYTNDEMIKLFPWLPLYYKAYSYAQPQTMPELGNGHIIPSEQIDDILCRWAYKVIQNEIEIQDAIANTQKDLEVFMEKFE